MIKSFIHKGLEKFFITGSKAGIQARHAKRIRLILAQLNQAKERTLNNYRISESALTCLAYYSSPVSQKHSHINNMKMNNPPHPGEILKGLWLAPMDISITDAAKSIGVSRKTLSKIINKKGNITPEMAVRLSLALGGSAESWMGHQVAFDLWKVEQNKEKLNVHPIWKTNKLAGHTA